MDKFYYLSLAAAVMLFTGCKKEYTCECFNPGGVYKVYKVTDTKKKAEKTCASHSEEPDTTWNEAGCVIKK
jgi:hypothetical protein